MSHLDADDLEPEDLDLPEATAGDAPIDPPTDTPFAVVVPIAEAGARLDQFLARQFPTYSRVHLRRLITAGCVQIGDRGGKPSYHLRGGETLTVTLPPLAREMPRGENIPLDILFEDDWLIAINKPPGMVVHPARGHWSGTLTSALQFHFDRLSQVGGPQRPGIVHRLDRDTSGVIVVAKDDYTHMRLATQFQERELEKEYFAIVFGRIDRDRDWIDAPIGIHPYQREKMAIRRDHPTSREARTFYEVIQRYVGFTTVRVLPKTGRTHQIRVHLDTLGTPVLCDKLYGGRSRITVGEVSKQLSDERVLLARQALHAKRIRIRHPQTDQPIEFEAPLPADLTEVVRALQAHRSAC